MRFQTGGTEERFLARVPCQLVKGTVHLRHPSSMGPLHLLTLEAIARNGDLRALLGAFGVGPRLMQTVLADLFYDSLVYLDLTEGVAVLAAPVKEAVGADLLAAIVGSKPSKEIEMTWVQDSISGGLMVYPFVSKYLASPDWVGNTIDLAPPPNPRTPIVDLSVRSLAQAARAILEEHAPASGSVVDRVEKITNRRAVGSRTFYVPVRVVRSERDDETLLLPDVEGVPRSIVDAWTALLNPKRDLIDSGDSNQLPRDPLTALTQSRLADAWRRQIKRARKIAKENADSRERIGKMPEVLDALEDLSRTLSTGESGAEQVEVCTGDAGVHHAILANEAKGAKDLIVIGSAFLSPRNLGPLLDNLEGALQRGVDVLLLWGTAAVESRDGERGTLAEVDSAVSRRFGADTPDRSHIHALAATAPFHSKFIAIDGRVAIVGSFNWLSSPPSATTWEASTLVRRGRIPQEVLGYALERTSSDHPLRARGESLLRGIGKEDLHDSQQLRPWEAAVKDMGAAFQELNEEGSESAWALLAQAVDRAEAVATAIETSRFAVLVRDGEHRRILTSGLAVAKQEIIITSDRVREDGAGSNFERLAKGAISRGVKVVIRWGREAMSSSVDEGVVGSQARVRQLKDSLGVGLDVNQAPCGSHSKVLVLDRTYCLVTSFNFLAFGGVRGGERTLSGELGIAFTGSTEAARIRASLPGAHSE
jgi:phosphatidylserine/phosphatidylglycerophosphate/cardiolipin synthase-like enzyme